MIIWATQTKMSAMQVTPFPHSCPLEKHRERATWLKTCFKHNAIQRNFISRSCQTFCRLSTNTVAIAMHKCDKFPLKLCEHRCIWFLLEQLVFNNWPGWRKVLEIYLDNDGALSFSCLRREYTEQQILWSRLSVSINVVCSGRFHKNRIDCAILFTGEVNRICETRLYFF